MNTATAPTAERQPLTLGQAESITFPLEKAYSVALVLQMSAAEDHITTAAEVIVDYVEAARAEVDKLTARADRAGAAA